MQVCVYLETNYECAWTLGVASWQCVLIMCCETDTTEKKLRRVNLCRRVATDEDDRTVGIQVAIR